MRNIAIAGILAIALVPLSLDRQPLSAHTVEAPPVSLAAAQDIVSSALFTAQRNAEIEKALKRSEQAREREFIAARNREIANAITASAAARPALVAEARAAEMNIARAALDDARTSAFTAARNQEIEMSMARAANARDAAFAAARNLEIELSLARVTAVNAIAALQLAAANPIETGSIGPAATRCH